MRTDTKASTRTPPRIAKYLTTTAVEFDRAMEDPMTLQCFTRCCFALLDKLDIRRHWLRENVHPESEALPDTDIPSADQEEQLLQRFADTVRERHPRFYAVYEEHTPSQLRRLCCVWLSQQPGHDESQTRLEQAAKAMPHEVTRQWDNPVRFVTDPVTAERSLGDVTSRTALTLIFSAQAFLKDFEPTRKAGRPRGIQKSTRSGKAPLSHEHARAVYQAIEEDGKDWQYCARKILNKTIPLEHRERERLRAYVGRLKYKGSIL